MKKFATIAVAVALAITGLSASAQIIIPPTMVTYEGQSGGVTLPNYFLSITYGVTESAGLYTYTYTLVTTPGEPMLSFTLGGNVDPVFTQSAGISNFGASNPALDGITGNSVVFGWNFIPGVTSDTVAFTSPYGPRLATFTLNDDDILWTSPDAIPAPTPVPEAPTVLAGVMMLLPFSVATFRSFSRARKA
jgi:hypothetical protein